MLRNNPLSVIIEFFLHKRLESTYVELIIHNMKIKKKFYRCR